MTLTSKKMTRYRFFIFLTLMIIIPIGLGSKWYKGPLENWFNHSAGGIFYEIFWIFLVTLIYPKIKPHITAIGVFIITSLLEFLQLWHPPFLHAIRENILGKLLIGTTFDGWDFLHYILGCMIAWFFLETLQNQLAKNSRDFPPNQL